MHWTDEDHPLWTWLLRCCAAATVLPLWSAAHLPFTDLPQHVAAIGTLRHWWDPLWKSQEYFTLALGQTQYLLYYLIGAALAFPLGTAERANLVLLSCVAVAFPYSLRALLRALKADARLALFACTLFWSQALLIGFFNYLAAMPLLLWALSLAVREAEAPSRRTLWTLALASVALFYLHLSAFLFFAPAAALASIALPRLQPVREWPRRLLWAAPVVVLSVLWLLNSPVVHPQAVGWHQPMTVAFEEPAVALRDLTDALLDIWRGREDEYALFLLVAAGMLLAWPQAREPDAQPWKRGLTAVWVALAALLYFAFPVSIGWMWQLNERYALVAALLLPTLLRPVRGLRGAVPLLVAAATALYSAGSAFATSTPTTARAWAAWPRSRSPSCRSRRCATARRRSRRSIRPAGSGTRTCSATTWTASITTTYWCTGASTHSRAIRRARNGARSPARATGRCTRRWSEAGPRGLTSGLRPRARSENPNPFSLPLRSRSRPDLDPDPDLDFDFDFAAAFAVAVAVVAVVVALEIAVRHPRLARGVAYGVPRSPGSPNKILYKIFFGGPEDLSRSCVHGVHRASGTTPLFRRRRHEV